MILNVPRLRGHYQRYQANSPVIGGRWENLSKKLCNAAALHAATRLSRQWTVNGGFTGLARKNMPQSIETLRSSVIRYAGMTHQGASSPCLGAKERSKNGGAGDFGSGLGKTRRRAGALSGVSGSAWRARRRRSGRRECGRRGGRTRRCPARG